MSSQATNTNRTELVNCAKCNGVGSLTWTHRNDGVCYDCKGTGKLTVEKLNASQAVQKIVNGLSYDADRIMQYTHAMGVNDIAQSNIGRMVPDMRLVGTDNARSVLGYLRAGKYNDDINGGHGQLGSELGAELAELLKAAGREVAA